MDADSNKIIPVLLAGGTGTRLWPQSRKTYPKQFSKILSENTLFQNTALRLRSTPELQLSAPITLANETSRFIVGEQLSEKNIELGSIIIEPEGRNTAPAILAATLFSIEQQTDPILLVMPTDHYIKDEAAFGAAIALGLEAAHAGNIVTFGVVPTHPETGYGYLKTSKPSQQQVLNVEQFVEKPNIAKATEFFESGVYLWNAGIFMFKASVLLTAFKEHAPDLIPPVTNALAASANDLDFKRLDRDAWKLAENVSIDYAVMEHCNNVVSVPLECGWSDLGDWNAILNGMEQDDSGVSTSLNAHALDCENSLLYSTSGDLELVGLGLKDIVAVAMPDAVLVADRNSTQDVGKIVKYMNAKEIKQGQNYPKDFRPWGWYESLTIRDRFQVKRILVHPGASLSLQSHHHRSEHWIVVEGTAKVTIDETVKLVTEGESVYIPLGAVHRMENPGKVPMVLIEVQIGAYLGEDDIIRYEDIYART